MDQITFGTDGWRATLDTFTDRRVGIVAQAVADYVESGTMAVGYDARETSRGFAERAAAVLAQNGIDVLIGDNDCPTPVLAWTLGDRDLDGGIMITASHNPPEYNGIKFLPPAGAPALPDVTETLVSGLSEPRALPEGDQGTIHQDSFTPRYGQHALSYLTSDLDELEIAYDAMHGSGRGVTAALLEEAGATVDCLRCEQDTEFGGVPPEPSADRLRTLEKHVTEGSADLGIANDGDADRIAIVTPERGYLDPNLFFAVLYEYLLESASGAVVRTVSTTSLLDRIAEAHDEAVVETPVGFKWVAQAMEEHDALLGGEESSGFGLTEHLRNKDGVVFALFAAAAHAERPLDKRADEITDTYGEIHQDRTSVACSEDRKEPVLDAIERELPDEIAGRPVDEIETMDGFKICLEDNSWLLVRPSGTEPKLRVYAEANSDERTQTLLDAGCDLIEPLVQPDSVSHSL